MSNQLERFHELSETRWPAFDRPDEPSGEGRKALSRYINEYIAELEKSDEELLSRRRRTTTAPPKTWEDNAPKLPMSRQEYIKKQNALFKELTGHGSWAELSAREAAKDNRDKRLMTTIELYMAALDEKIYMSADYTRALIGVRDKLVRDEIERLRLEDDEEQIDTETTPSKPSKAFLRSVVELRDMYRDLWVQHSQLSHQRDALEIEMSQLRYDHALQYAKNLRLEYATHSLGQRLVDAQAFRHENEQMKEQIATHEREKESMQNTIDALNAKVEAQSRLIEQMSLKFGSQNGETGGSATPGGSGNAGSSAGSSGGSSGSGHLETQISLLYDELVKLKANEEYNTLHPDPPKTALECLDQALALIQIGNETTDKRITSLIEAFSHQYRAREQELLTKASCLEQEKQIVIARCEKLEKESAEANSDLSYLEQRTLSLVLMLKSVRASLDGTGTANEPINDPATTTDIKATTLPESS